MKVTTFLLSLCFCISAFSQDFKFGKVSKEELQEKFNPNDSSASATYLYKYRRSFFQYMEEEGFTLVTEIHERIKIYNKEGFNYATKKIKLHKENNKEEKVMGLKAYTYNFSEGKIDKVKLDKEGVFNIEKSKYQNETNFTMPNLKEGSVIEFKYKIDSPFYWHVPDFVFQNNIPVKKLDAIFEVPEYFNFKTNATGFLIIKTETDIKPDKLRYKVEVPISQNGSMDARMKYQTGEIDFLTNITSYSVSNIPPLKEEPYVNNINNYRSAIKYELSYTNFPQTPIKYYSTSWENVVKTIYDSPNFGKELDKSGYYEDDVDAIIAEATSPIQKAALIYSLVRSQVRWNGYYGKFTDDGVKRAYQIKTGNVAEINLMLTAMLRYAGLNANPVLVSTRHNGIPLFPTIDGYNYVISAIETPKGTMLLDATSNYGVPNVLPVRTLNWEGRIVRKNKSSSTINLYPHKKSKKVVSLLANLEANGALKGSIRTIKTNYKAMSYRENFHETGKDLFVENLENKYIGIEIENFEVKNDTDLSKPVTESFKFTLESQADIINNKIYFSPLFFLKTSKNPFKLEKRDFPVDFSYPYSNKFTIIVNLPKGYKIEAIPESAAMILPDNLGSFKYKISPTATKVQIVVETEINQPIISSIHYDALKAYFDKLIEKESEQIALIKS